MVALFCASVHRATDAVMHLALYPLVPSQAPQHFRSSETRATNGGSFARQSICSVISHNSSKYFQNKLFVCLFVGRLFARLVPCWQAKILL